MKKRIQHIALVFFIIFINIGCDQHTKQLAHANLKYKQTTSYWNDTFKLMYAENEGAFLSWGSDLPQSLHIWLLKIIPICLLVGMTAYTLFSKSVDTLQALGLSFIIGGGLSNLYDRVTYGKVIDFMNMGIGDLRTGIFNVADISILIGIAIILIGSWKRT